MNGSRLKLRISSLLGHRGFGLAETMISIAIVGVLIVTVISQQKVSNKSITVVASDTTINDVVRMTIGEITDQATCTKNFLGKDKDNTYLQLINSGTNQPFLVKDARYGVGGVFADGNKTVLGEVQLTKIETQKIVPTDNPYAMILRLTFKRKDVAGGLFSSKTVTRDIAINTVVDGAGKISSCFGDFNLLAQSAVRAACVQNAIGANLAYAAVYEEPTAAHPYGRCIHDAGDQTCPNGGILTKVTATNGKVTYTCGSLSSACPVSGQFIVGFNEAGTPKCDYPLPKCVLGEVVSKTSSGAYTCKKLDCSAEIPISAFGGFKANGDVICNQITNVNPCSNSFATTVAANGEVTCSPVVVTAKKCPVGQRLNSIDASGNPICTPFMVAPYTCPGPTAVLKAINADGSWDCQDKVRPLKCGTTPVHSDAECSALGGSPANLGTDATSQCYFSGTTCPGGWTRCSSWTKQNNVTCTDTSNTFYCNANIQTRTATQGGGGQINTTALGSTTCVTWTGAPNNGKACNQVAHAPTYTQINFVGCY